VHRKQPHADHRVGNRWTLVHIYDGQVIFAGQSPHRLATTVEAPAVSNFLPSAEKFHGVTSGSDLFGIPPSRLPKRDPLGGITKIQVDSGCLLVPCGKALWLWGRGEVEHHRSVFLSLMWFLLEETTSYSISAVLDSNFSVEARWDLGESSPARTEGPGLNGASPRIGCNNVLYLGEAVKVAEQREHVYSYPVCGLFALCPGPFLRQHSMMTQ